MIDLFGVILFEVSVDQDGKPKPPMLHLPIFKLVRSENGALMWEYVGCRLGGFEGFAPSAKQACLALAEEKGYFFINEIKIDAEKDFRIFCWLSRFPFKESDIAPR